MKVLTVTTLYRGGGAEGVARDLARGLALRGIESHVRVRPGEAAAEPGAAGPGVSAIPFDKRAQPLLRRGVYYAKRLVQELGVESWASPALRHVLDGLPWRPDVVHLHNIHGGFIRLEDLEWLCERVPVVWTLHDMWAVTGHCAQSFECDRWRTTCGRCPHMDIYPRIRLDFSRLNRLRRARLYSRIARRLPGRLHLVCPSRWLADIVRQSVARELPVHLVPHGIDTAVFHPFSRDEKLEFRRKWGVRQDAVVVLFASNRGRENPFKDYATFAEAARIVHPQDRSVQFVLVGDRRICGVIEDDGGMLSVGPIASAAEMAEAYALADIYVHCTHAESFGLSVVEALACGTPAIASAVGPVPGLFEDGREGFHCPPDDGPALAAILERLVDDGRERRRLSEAAASHAVRQYALGTMVSEYAALYERVVKNDAR